MFFSRREGSGVAERKNTATLLERREGGKDKCQKRGGLRGYVLFLCGINEPDSTTFSQKGKTWNHQEMVRLTYCEI